MTETPVITGRSWAMILALGFVWGATFMVQDLALDHMPPVWIAAARTGFAALLTVSVWRLFGTPLWTGPARAWTMLVIVSLCSAALPFIALAWAQQHVTSGYVGVSMAAVALIVLPLAHLFVPGERMTLRRTAGFLIGFLGVAVLMGPSIFASTGADSETAGRLACLFAAFCYALSSILMRRLPPVDPVALSAMTLVIGATLVIPLALIVEGPPPRPAPEGLALLLLLGLLPTAGANLLRVLTIRSAGPVFMSLTNYMVPLWSVSLGVLVLGEPFRWSLIVALGLILAGVFLSQWGALRRLFSRRSSPNLNQPRGKI